MAITAFDAVSLASENTVVGLADPAAETLSGSDRITSGWHLATVDGLTHAEDLLDSLESHGFENRELLVLDNSCFAVRWR